MWCSLPWGEGEALLSSPTPRPAELARAPNTPGSKGPGHPPRWRQHPPPASVVLTSSLRGLRPQTARSHGSDGLGFLVLTLLGLDQGSSQRWRQPLQERQYWPARKGRVTASDTGPHPCAWAHRAPAAPMAGDSKAPRSPETKPRGGLVRNSQRVAVWKSFLRDQENWALQGQDTWVGVSSRRSLPQGGAAGTCTP